MITQVRSSPARGDRWRVAGGLIRYANCWEDARILIDALRPGPGRRVLSIASGGDNSLALLATGAEVVAVDVNAAQLACLELKCAAFRNLDYGRMLAFLGVRPACDRGSVYARLRRDISPGAREFWDARPSVVRNGIVHAGKFENFFRIFRTRILPLIHSRKTVEELLKEKDGASRQEFYEKRWNNRRWKTLSRIFFSRAVMGRLGRDPECFRHVSGSVAGRILERARRALTAASAHSNPFLEYILTGGFSRNLPRYLEPGSFEKIRGGLDRLSLFHGTVEDAAGRHGAAGFDGFNLSDIFEYLSPASSRETGAALLRSAKAGARLAYWNMLVPRRLAKEFPDRMISLEERSRSLFSEDRAFFYGDFILEETPA